jgi:hypothetical protein
LEKNVEKLRSSDESELKIPRTTMQILEIDNERRKRSLPIETLPEP